MSDDTRFADLIGAVTPMPHKAQHPDFARPPVPNAAHARRRQAAEGSRPVPLRRADSVRFNFDDIPAERFAAMRQGDVPFARIIDLHGYFVDEGITLLDDALYQRRNRRREIWLVIHGKGRNSPAHDRAPLKQAVIDLLCQHPAIAALVSLQDSARESGALCIDVHPARKP